MKRIRSSLFENNGFRANSLLTFWTSVECFGYDIVGMATFRKEIGHFIAFRVKSESSLQSFRSLRN